jgi:2-phosphosulfolactate phosphatase
MQVDGRLIRTVTVGCFPESLAHYRDGYAIVAVDVIRATTTAVTGSPWAEGASPHLLSRRQFPSPQGSTTRSSLASWAATYRTAFTWRTALPRWRSRGTSLARRSCSLPRARRSSARPRDEPPFTRRACATSLRNYTARVRSVAARHPKVAVIGAGTRLEFREEDQMCCAWIA